MDLNSDFSKSSSDRRFRNTARELVKRWRYRGHTGRLIRSHRALRTLDIRRSSLAHPILLTAGILSTLVAGRDILVRSWVEILRFWCSSTGVDVALRVRSVSTYGNFEYLVPQLRAASPMPSSSEILWVLFIVVAAMLTSYVFLRRFLPACYLVWALCLVQLSSLVFFQLSPVEFPYSLGSHVSSSLELVLMLVMMIPFLLMVAYYPLNFSLSRKLALTVIMLGMVCVFAPHLYACHIVIVSHISLLYLPLLFTFFGLLPIILMIVAIYGWGMSWNQRT